MRSPPLVFLRRGSAVPWPLALVGPQRSSCALPSPASPPPALRRPRFHPWRPGRQRHRAFPVPRNIARCSIWPASRSNTGHRRRSSSVPSATCSIDWMSGFPPPAMMHLIQPFGKSAADGVSAKAGPDAVRSRVAPRLLRHRRYVGGSHAGDCCFFAYTTFRLIRRAWSAWSGTMSCTRTGQGRMNGNCRFAGLTLSAICSFNRHASDVFDYRRL